MCPLRRKRWQNTNGTGLKGSEISGELMQQSHRQDFTRTGEYKAALLVLRVVVDLNADTHFTVAGKR